MAASLEEDNFAIDDTGECNETLPNSSTARVSEHEKRRAAVEAAWKDAFRPTDDKPKRDSGFANSSSEAAIPQQDGVRSISPLEDLRRGSTSDNVEDWFLKHKKPTSSSSSEIFLGNGPSGGQGSLNPASQEPPVNNYISPISPPKPILRKREPSLNPSKTRSHSLPNPAAPSRVHWVNSAAIIVGSPAGLPPAPTPPPSPRPAPLEDRFLSLFKDDEPTPNSRRALMRSDNMQNNFSSFDPSQPGQNAQTRQAPNAAQAQQINGTNGHGTGFPNVGAQADMNVLWEYIQNLSQMHEGIRAQTQQVLNGVQQIQARAGNSPTGEVLSNGINGQLHVKSYL